MKVPVTESVGCPQGPRRSVYQFPPLDKKWAYRRMAQTPARHFLRRWWRLQNYWSTANWETTASCSRRSVSSFRFSSAARWREQSRSASAVLLPSARGSSARTLRARRVRRCS
jgi:hypothetical protein